MKGNYRLSEDWKFVKLGDACKVIMGQSPPSTTYNDRGIGLPFFQGKAEFTDLHPIVEKWCSEPKKIAEPNDILLSVRAPVGNTNIANIKCCIGRGLAAIRFENYKYAFYFLRSKKQELDNKGTGTTFKAISGEILRETLFPLPPKETQQAIVSKIDELFSELDKGIENLLIAQQQLKTYRQAVLKWAFEGRLTNNDVKEGELPEGWTLVTLEQVSKISGGLTKNAKRNNLKLKLPYLRVANVYFNRLDLSEIQSIGINESEIKRVTLKNNDLLFVEGNGSIEQIGRVALWNGSIKTCVHQNHIIKSRLSEEIVPKFALYYFCSKEGRDKIKKQAKSTSGLHTLSLGKISNLELPKPSTKEQNAIIKAIESRLSAADKMEESITQGLQQSEALRQSILKKAFEGKLVKNEQIFHYKPKNEYFYQLQILALIARASKEHEIVHGEMTLAKYAYLVDKIYKVPTYFVYNKWHLGPYSPAIKKVVGNKTYFNHIGGNINVINDSKLFKYKNPFENQVVAAIDELAEIFSKYPIKERSHKTELLATLCKVIEDSQTLDLKQIRRFMKGWIINLKNTSIKNKGEKFSEEETKNCISFIQTKGWDKKLLN